jgi:hypothetical protein
MTVRWRWSDLGRQRPHPHHRDVLKSVKWNSLLCNLILFHTAIDMMEVFWQLVCRGVAAEDLAQLSPYLTSHILRFGAYATDELHIPPDVFDPAMILLAHGRARWASEIWGVISLPPLWLTWDLAGRGCSLSLIRPLRGNSGRQGRALG